jgi:hypothetical protein
MIDSQTLNVMLLVTGVLDDLAVPYVIGGSMASIIHGMIRTTMDADIVADLKSEQVDRFVASLREQFYVDETAVHQAINKQSSFNLIHLTTMFKVDIFIPKNRAFDQQQLKRRINEKVSSETDKSVWVLSAEDIILAKLDWFRLGGEVSERQWRDVLGVIKTQELSLDIPYLQEWAQQLGIADLLARALDEISSPKD